MKPLVSVVMATFNGEKYIQQAIKSVLDQTFKDFEFIIIANKTIIMEMPNSINLFFSIF